MSALQPRQEWSQMKLHLFNWRFEAPKTFKYIKSLKLWKNPNKDVQAPKSSKWRFWSSGNLQIDILKPRRGSKSRFQGTGRLQIRILRTLELWRGVWGLCFSFFETLWELCIRFSILSSFLFSFPFLISVDLRGFLGISRDLRECLGISGNLQGSWCC